MSERSSNQPLRLDRRPVAELIEVLGAAAMHGVIERFITDTAARLTAIEQAAAARGLTEIGNHLHTLKTTSATLGLVAMAELARAVEEEAERTSIGAARLAELRTVFDASIAELGAAFPEIASPS